MNFKIKNKIIGDNSPVFIVAELLATHLQKYNNAVQLIKKAKECGADAVKLQTFTPDTITLNCSNRYFQIKHGKIRRGKTLYELYKEAFTPWEWHVGLKKTAEDLGMIFFSTPFDRTAVDFLEKIKVPLYKIASFEITDIPLVEYIASKGKPVIMSTGIAMLDDINLAVKACRGKGNKKIALLKCTSEYPPAFEDVNLNTIPDMKKRLKTVVGLSDHTLGISVPIAAVAMGVKIIEKHFILDRKMGSPDAGFSLEPDEFKSMVRAVREAEKAMGKVTYNLSKNIKKIREYSRSLFVVKDIKEGDEFTEENIRSIRPGNGLAPKYLKDILGKKAAVNLTKGSPLKWKYIYKKAGKSKGF